MQSLVYYALNSKFLCDIYSTVQTWYPFRLCTCICTQPCDLKASWLKDGICKTDLMYMQQCLQFFHAWVTLYTQAFVYMSMCVFVGLKWMWESIWWSYLNLALWWSSGYLNETRANYSTLSDLYSNSKRISEVSCMVSDSTALKNCLWLVYSNKCVLLCLCESVHLGGIIIDLPSYGLESVLPLYYNFPNSLMAMSTPPFFLAAISCSFYWGETPAAPNPFSVPWICSGVSPKLAWHIF